MSDRVMTVVVKREGDLFVAQCDPYDICTQGRDLDQLFRRLHSTICIEIEWAGSLENVPQLPPDMQHKEG